MIPRLISFTALFLCLAIAASCTVSRFVMADRGEQDAKVILQGMKSARLRPGDAPVTIAPE